MVSWRLFCIIIFMFIFFFVNFVFRLAFSKIFVGLSSELECSFELNSL